MGNVPYNVGFRSVIIGWREEVSEHRASWNWAKIWYMTKIRNALNVLYTICRTHMHHGVAMLMDLGMHYHSLFPMKRINTWNNMWKCIWHLQLGEFYIYTPSQSILNPPVTIILTLIIIDYFCFSLNFA